MKGKQIRRLKIRVKEQSAMSIMHGRKDMWMGSEKESIGREG